ncbi:hypothetical protein V5799_024811 [Amblyomma americanum]|uniref:Small ribosomal subunit protein mS23 n=1 Tax=Amblyomma americanum TaxID=6943 RepID=A0AAQ4EB97_AMBAM
MAGSRIYKLGSIFTRVEGLVKAGGMQPSEQPLWLDVYRAFPPLEEPSFYRTVTATSPVRSILYPEDVARMQFYREHGNTSVDLQNTTELSPCQRFLQESSRPDQSQQVMFCLKTE